MADKGKWAKLHIGWDDDPHIDALSLEDQARWCKFVTYMKEHGTDGTIKIVSPARVLQHKFRVFAFDEVIKILKSFPNVHVGEEANSTVSPGTVVIVSFLNWFRFQGDLSSDRVRKFRRNETAKRRGEEKRRDKKRNIFVQPTVLEVKDFANSEKIPLDCQKFYDFYSSKGWMVGRNKMKDWKAAARLAAKDWATTTLEKSSVPQWMKQ